MFRLFLHFFTSTYINFGECQSILNLYKATNGGCSSFNLYMVECRAQISLLPEASKDMDWAAAWSQWTTIELYISPQNLVFFHHLLVFFHNPSSKSMPFWPNNISEGGMLIMHKFADCIKQNLNIEGKCLLLLCISFNIY